MIDRHRTTPELERAAFGKDTLELVALSDASVDGHREGPTAMEYDKGEAPDGDAWYVRDPVRGTVHYFVGEYRQVLTAIGSLRGLC